MAMYLGSIGASVIQTSVVTADNVSSSSEMDAKLIESNLGLMYHYVGTSTSSYIYGRYYLVIEDEGVIRFREYLHPGGSLEINDLEEHDVTDKVTAQVVDSDLVASNIKKDVDILGVTGTLEVGIFPTGNKAITAATSEQTGIDVYDKATVSVAPTPSESQAMALGASAPQSVTPSSGKLLSSVIPSVDSEVIKAENIKVGVQILGVTGTHEGQKEEQSKSMSLGSSAPSAVTPDSGKALSSVTPSIDSSIIKAENIAEGVTMLGIAGSHAGQKEEQTKILVLGASAPSAVTPDSGKVLSSVPVSIDGTAIKAEYIAKDQVILGITGTHEGGSSRVRSISPTKNGTYYVQSDLTIVESMTLTGQAYCNLADIIPPDIIYWDIEAEFIATASFGTADRNRLFGCQGNDTYQYDNFTFYQSNKFSLVRSYSASASRNLSVSLTPVIGTLYHIECSTSQMTVNGTTSTSSTETGALNCVSLDLFALHTKSDTHTDRFQGTFKYIKLGTDHWLVSARDSDNVPYIYDKITGKKYAMTGSGITLGADVSDESYVGFASPLTVNVSKYGATVDDFFNNLLSGVYDPPTSVNDHEIVFTGMTTLASSNNYPYLFAYKFAYCSAKKIKFPDLTTINCQNAFYYGFQYAKTEEIDFPSLTTVALSHTFYYGFYYCKAKKISFGALTSVSKTYMYYHAFDYAGSQTDPLTVDFPELTTISGGSAFSNAFYRAYIGYGILHPFPKLTTIGAASTLTSAFTYTNCIRYIFDKLTAVSYSNTFTTGWQYCNPGGSAYDETHGIMFPMLETIGVSGSTSIYRCFTSCCLSSNNKMNAYFTSLTAIYNNHTTASNAHFATCGLVKIFLPKLTALGSKPEYTFYNSTTITELHFGIENQSTIEALTGYSSKFGATAATIYFDLANHLTINGTVYDRDGSKDDYDNWYFGFTNGDTTYYIDNYYGAVGDVAYTKSGDTYTASGYTITGVA